MNYLIFCLIVGIIIGIGIFTIFTIIENFTDKKFDNSSIFFLLLLAMYITVHFLNDYGLDIYNKYFPTNKTTSKVQTESNGLQLLESYKCNLDYGVRGVCGIIKNNSPYTYSYVQVEINLYDSNGTLIGSTLSNINNFRPNHNWKFKAIVLDYDAYSFKVENITAF